MRLDTGDAGGMSTSLPPWLPPDLFTRTLMADKLKIANLTTRVEDDDWIGIVDTVILCLTILGALTILGSTAFFEYRGRPSTTRMRIVQSLVVSDLVIGIVGLIGSALAFEQKLIKGSTDCDGLGVMLVAVLWSEHLWTLTLAVSTFFILMKPLSTITLWLERSWAWLWALVWTIAFGVAVLGYELYGYVPSGGICYYPDKSGLYGELIQFIPRGIVFTVIACLYGRLYIFLRRPDKIKVSFSGTNGTGSNGFITSVTHNTRFFRLPSFFGRKPSSSAAPATMQEKTRDYAAQPSVTTPQPPSPKSEAAPWEKLELPPFQVDGQRYGGSASSQPGSNMFGWRSKGKRESSVASRPGTGRSTSSTSPPHSPVPGAKRQFGSLSSSVGAMTRSQLGRPMSPRSKLEPYIPAPPAIELEGESTPTPASVAALQARRRSGELSASLSTIHAERLRKMSGPQPDGLSIPTDTHSEYNSDSRRPSAMTDSSLPLTSPTSPTSPTHSPVPDSATPLRASALSGPSADANTTSQIASFHSYRMSRNDPDEAGEMGFLDMLQNHQPPVTDRDRFRPDTDADNFELVEESMASYLNRKTALLMLWFPLGYVLLFSISLIRIIYDFAGTPPTILRALSRWFIFAQGILDALIYGFVEWHTKRVVRKRVKRGHFSTQSQTGSFQAMASALRNIGSKRPSSPRVTQTGVRSSHSPITSMVRQTQSVSFDPIEEEHRNILQELNDTRKASLPSSSVTAPVSIDVKDESSGRNSDSGQSGSVR